MSIRKYVWLIDFSEDQEDTLLASFGMCYSFNGQKIEL